MTGQAQGLKHTIEYHSWRGMMYRCTWPTNPSYPAYGGKGIQVHGPWHDFACFLADMGPCPKGCQLGRLNPRQSYTPENTRWLTRSQWQRVRGAGRRLEYEGQARTVVEWSEKLGIKADTIRSRLRLGWEVSQVLGFEARPKVPTRRARANGAGR